MLMSDIWIKEQCTGEKPMISPFTDQSVSRLTIDGKNGRLPLSVPITSYGLSSYGYDLSLGNKFKILRPVTDFYRNAITGQLYEDEQSYEKAGDPLVIDPCNFNPVLFRDVEVEVGQQVIIPPRGFALSAVGQHLDLPDDIMGVCMEKSTIARTAVEVTVTPVEAGWRGYLTLEICNKTDYPAVLTAGMGITQLMFFKGDQPCSVPYHARNGKYQDQPAEPVIARMKD